MLWKRPALHFPPGTVAIHFPPGTKAYLTFSTRLSSEDDFEDSGESLVILICLCWQQWESFVLAFCCLLLNSVFSLFSGPFGLAWCFVTRCSRAVMSRGVSLVVCCCDQAPRTGPLLHCFKRFGTRAGKSQPQECPNWGAFQRGS